MPSLRVVSADARSFGRDRAALGAAIAAHNPAVAVVHCAPRLSRWRSLSAEIARHAGLVVVSGGRTGGGNLILSSLAVDVTHTSDVLLGRNPLRPTGVTIADLRYRGVDLTVAAGSGDESGRADLDAALPSGAALLSLAGNAATLAGRGPLAGNRFVVPASMRLVEESASDVVTIEVELDG